MLGSTAKSRNLTSMDLSVFGDRFEKDAYRHDPIQQIGPRQFILCFYSEIEKLEYLHRLVVSGKEGK